MWPKKLFMASILSSGLNGTAKLSMRTNHIHQRWRAANKTCTLRSDQTSPPPRSARKPFLVMPLDKG